MQRENLRNSEGVAIRRTVNATLSGLRLEIFDVRFPGLPSAALGWNSRTLSALLLTGKLFLLAEAP